MLEDLKMIIEEDQGTGKAVVFSQMKSTIDHMATVLEEEVRLTIYRLLIAPSTCHHTINTVYQLLVPFGHV